MERLRFVRALLLIISYPNFFLLLFFRKKVTKKLLIPEGDFCARGKAQNHG